MAVGVGLRDRNRFRGFRRKRSRPALRRPFLVCGFEGWSDAGDAATMAVSYLAELWDAQPLATVDHEEFFHFQHGEGRRKMIERLAVAHCAR